MSTPYGALANTAVSLAKASKNPTLTNIVAIAPVAAQIADGNLSLNTNVTNGAALIGSAGRLLKNGSAFETVNTVNTAVRFAQGFLDPNTRATVGAITGGLNQLFGINGVFGPALGIGAAKGNKPVALHTESMKAQKMSSAYSEGNEVIFSLVRADSNSPADSSPSPGANGSDQLATDKAAAVAPPPTAPTASQKQFTPLQRRNNTAF